MDLTPERLREDLGNAGLKADEIDATVVRLGLLQDHARTLESKMCIVDDFTSWSGVNQKTGERMNASDFIMSSPHDSYVKQFVDLKENCSTYGAPVLALDKEKHGKLD